MAEARHFVVIGLGTFGSALARQFCSNDCRVTGMDADRDRIDDLKEILYEAVIGDATDREALMHLPIRDANAVFVSLGEDITRSLLATLHIKELGATRIIVKGVTDEHGKILSRLGVERVIYPETEIAQQLADHFTWPNIVDYLPIDPEFSFVEIAIPDSFVGQTLQQMNLRRRLGVWIVGVKDALTGKLEMFPDGEFRLGADQMLLLVGRHSDLNRLRDLK